ncbi:MAG: hypothetical protein A2563_00675 [Candidatus Magasanikbacteria bacterium RIFOXYD1_FULL_40_23]|uniref:Uncharacterized protein n=1 Tax=Candidatus Magasanikbacteria bacterium RIFOXYD1_FULL_40_23 TaxID=1798705 RepID=A0A1F6P7D6_9BACT|nr:MAG: hypothetical protein A2563_00675 [Candidatus Magasanikbacteria bacterium RIFOXYD1_FULL_40_23]
MLFKKAYRFGDKLEDKVRGKLSHFPIIYAFFGGAGVIIFWRGIWHTVDYVMEYFFATQDIASAQNMPHMVWWDGPLSIMVGAVILLLSGLFVTSFIGNEIIISGLKGEKKIAEKTEEDIKVDLEESIKMKQEMHAIDKRLDRIESLLEKDRPSKGV